MVHQSEILLATPEFRRLVAYSAGAHVLLMMFLAIDVWPRTRLDTPPPVFVDLIAAPAPASEARPAPPRQRVEQPVVIPKKPPKVQAKPKPKPKLPEPKVVPEPEPKAEPTPRSAAELLSDIRERMEARAGTETSSTSQAASRGRFDPQLAGYRKEVMVLLRSNWIGARVFRSQPDLEVRYEVRIDSLGAVRSVSLLRGSGSAHFDESAERAIRRSQPFPRPPRGAMTLDIGFSPTSVF